MITSQDESQTEGPLAVLDFWFERQSNLLSILGQLDTEPVKQTAAALKACNSSYLAAFER